MVQGSAGSAFRVQKVQRLRKVEVVGRAQQFSRHGAITAQATFATITGTVTATNVETPTMTPTNVSAGRISAVGGTAGAVQQAGMRAIRLGARMEW